MKIELQEKQTELITIPIMSMNLKNYVIFFENFIDQKTCKTIVKKLKKEKWGLHSYNSGEDVISFENDLSVCSVTFPEAKTLQQNIWHALRAYIDNYKFPWFPGWAGYTDLRFNKYDVGTEMRLHCDHITSIFDGTIKGVPVLTILGSLNDNYSGGELVMFGNEQVKLEAGSLMIFPSNFLYPHQVLPITKGTRYSYVSWVWA